MKTIDTSIIISTYNNTQWLEKVLYGYNNQTYRLFEIVIADDGSGPQTKALLERLQKEVFYPIVHVWHEDNGFQKVSDYQEGDCLVYKYREAVISHAGVYLSNNKILHHLPDKLSCIDAVDSSKILGGYRYANKNISS